MTILKNSHQLLRWLLIFAIFVDNINGYWQDNGVMLSIGMLFRGTICLLVLRSVLFRGEGWINTFFWIICTLYIFFMPVWIATSMNFSVKQELNYLFRLIYFFAVVLYVYNDRQQIVVIKILKLIVSAAIILGVLNITSFVTGLGVKSYGEDYGFGTKAFYADGNSFGLFMVLSLCMMMWYSFYTNKLIYYLLSLLVTFATLLIGSRVAIGGVVIACTILPIYFCLFRDNLIRISRLRKNLILIVGSVVVGVLLYQCISYIILYDQYTMGKFSAEGALSARDNLKECGKYVISQRTGLSYLIGGGASTGSYQLGSVYLDYGQRKFIEADNYDLLLNFGYGFGGLMILFHFLIYLIVFIKPYVRTRNSLSFTLLVAGTIWYGSAIFAGHAFFNTMLVPLIAVMIVIARRIVVYQNDTSKVLS